ncbi:TPA: DUF2481 family protein [Listeria monocytogenes]|uniref:DUF2481 domain-containing protein n=3 Tax=root TaxID=1 RepID=A0A2U8UUR0_9CAUD|nr:MULTISPECIES: DUF2481 family protein [Bacillales]AWN07955.1 hypothetical protein [Listeria phage PSU-VKH-LP040]AGR12563.1 DUF2481 domain-containing protein [Listeria monocytogenes]AHF27915.1 hypothetical protein A407_0126 [Listeria monocytogenes serotype 4b str. 81-0861]ASH31111.1 hypothetical protein A408_0126 [Listeria monocytogenes serotype 4b str. 10-0809]ASH77371.1 hypothetical protein A405_0120 [Listeria monocytogenes serotype 4b str. 81-0558]
MAVMGMTKNKARQREIISHLLSENLSLSKRKELQKELNRLMKENTEEKQKTYWSKTFDRVVGNKKWEEITLNEFIELRHAGLSGYAIAGHFGITRAVVFNYTRNNRTEYYQLFDMREYRKNKEMWSDK